MQSSISSSHDERESRSPIPIVLTVFHAMGQPISTHTKPTPFAYDAGPWPIAILMASLMTLWMGSLKELPPEAYGFYLVWSRVNVMAILALIGHRIWSSYDHKLRVEAWNAAQNAAKRARPHNHGLVDFSKKPPFSFWDLASRAHPSAFLTTSLVRPRVFPFPLGFATKPGTELRSSAGDPAKDASAATSSLYWESGLQPHVGRFQIGAAFDAKAREAQVKATSAALKEGGPESDASRKMRGEIYTERRRMAHQRIHHLKLLCMLALLSFASRRLAGLAAVPVLYGIWSSEMERLLVGRKSEYKHPKRGKALRAGKVEGEKQPPGMGMGYLYRPVGTTGLLNPLAETPMLNDPPALMTSQDLRLASTAAAGAKESSAAPPWIGYQSSSSSRSGGAGSLGGGGSGGGGAGGGDMSSLMASLGL